MSSFFWLFAVFSAWAKVSSVTGCPSWMPRMRYLAVFLPYSPRSYMRKSVPSPKPSRIMYPRLRRSRYMRYFAHAFGSVALYWSKSCWKLRVFFGLVCCICIMPLLCRYRAS